MKITELRLTANNSSGHQTLYITIPDKESQHENEVWCTLCGQYKGKGIQIDFDSINKEQFISYLQNTLLQLKRND